MFSRCTDSFAVTIYMAVHFYGHVTVFHLGYTKFSMKFSSNMLVVQPYHAVLNLVYLSESSSRARGSVVLLLSKGKPFGL
jgi:hypothetical protein